MRHFINGKFQMKLCWELVMQEFCTVLWIKQKSQIAVHVHSQSSGQAECASRMTKGAAWKLVKAGNKNWDEGLSSILIGICSLRLWLEENWKQTNRKTHNNASYKQSSQLNGNHELLTDHRLEKLQSNLAGINQGIGDHLESDCEWKNKQRIVTNRNTRGKQEIFFFFFFRNLHKKHIFLYKWDGSSTLVSRANPALYLIEINPKWK